VRGLKTLLGSFEHSIWITAIVLEAGVAVCALFRRDFLRYISIVIYMFAASAVDYSAYLCVQKYGSSSHQYYFLYHYSESLMAILMYSVIIQFYLRVFSEMKLSRFVQGAAFTLLAGTAVISYLVVRQNRAALSLHFVMELGQNLHFVGVVLIYLLWGALLKLKETQRQLVHLVLELGIYFGLTAGTYALRNLFPNLYPFVRWMLPIIGLWLPAAWGYTIVRLPKESRLAMSELTAKA
jgi:hypothetical protein